jgi:ATP-binding cassette, subfamily B, multidrug efflux pump
MIFRFFERLLNPFPDAEPVCPPNQFWAFCRHFCRGSELYLLAMALLTATVAIIEVMLFQFLGQLVDWLGAQSPETLWQTSSTKMIGMSLLVLLGLPATIFFHSTVIHQTLLGNFPMNIRWQAHRYLLNQSLSFYQDEFAGRIATKVMQTALAVRETMMKLLDVFLYSGVFFMGILAVAANLDWRLSLPFIGWLVIYIGLIRYFVPRLQAVSEIQADARSEMTGRIVDTYTNIATVKLFSHARREAEYAKESMDIFLQAVHPQMRLVTLFSCSVWTINALLIFSTCATSLLLWSQGAVGAGAIAAAVGIVMRLYGMSQWVMWEVSALFENIGTVHDGMTTLTRTQQVVDRANAQPLIVTSGNIEFRNVCFHYGKRSGVLEQFNLDIRAGEKVAIVGRSGAGKSTLVNLLLRFYDLESGSILIDGQNIAEVQQESLRKQIGMVTQDTSLLHRSLRENLTYGKPDASENEIMHALQHARADEFVAQLEDPKGRKGLEAHVGERGVKLSGGQRQRIAIARVLLKNAPILILDEATSALDSEVENAIQDNLYELMAGKTVIAIAHRLSTIAAMDRLIVLDKGGIAEQGTHSELIASNGIYARLWARQSGGFIGEE